MRVLLTGASGFVGRHLGVALLQEGHELHCVSRQPHSGEPGHWHVADLSLADEVDELVSDTRPDQILHFGSLVTGSREVSAVHETLTHNLLSTVNLLTAASRYSVDRLTLAGSMEEPMLEEGEVDSYSPYAVSKASSALYGNLFRDLYGVEFVHLRLFMIFGPDQPDRMKFVPYVVDECLRGRVPKLSSGVRPVDWIFVTDVVQAALAAIGVSSPPPGPVDIGSGELRTLREVAEHIAEQIPEAGDLGFEGANDRGVERIRAADLRAASEYLSWQPATSFEDGVRQTVAWHRKNPMPESPAPS